MIGMMGLSFGASRVTTAALALDGSFDSDLVSRRISVYTVTLSIAQTIGPFVAGWVAYWFNIQIAIAGIPLVVILLYVISLVVIPNLSLPTVIITLKRTAH
jgi:MFS family permease